MPAHLSFATIDLEMKKEVEKEALVSRLAAEDVHRRFDLSRDLPLRVTLLRLAEDDHVLLVTVHHIAFDGWSKSVFFRELSMFYESFVTGSQPAVTDLPIQYADYASWQRRYLEGETGERSLVYWKERLSGLPSCLELPTDRIRPSKQTFRGGRARRLLSRRLANSLCSLSRFESVTLFMTLLTAYQVLLSRYSGATDICVGCPAANRVRKETEELVGPFINVVPMRSDLSGDPTFRTLLARVREMCVAACDHQEIPLERLIEVLQPERSPSYSPLFQVMFQLRNMPDIVLRLSGLNVSPVELDPGTSQVDLALDVTETDHGLDCVLNFNSDLFDAETAERILGHYETLLAAAADNPDVSISQVPLLTEIERQQLLVQWNQTETHYPDARAVDLFEAQATKTPQATAAMHEGRQWSYAELNRYADRVARRLRSAGVSRGALVAICVERSLEMLGALLGIWKAGGVYLPLDPAYPKDRLCFVLRDAEPAAFLTETKLRDGFAELRIPVVLLDECEPETQGDWDAVFLESSIDDLAYVIYTSGSSGKPKGVAISHRSLTNLLDSMRRELELTSADSLLAITTISFDIAHLELFLPLIAGGRVVILSRAVALDPRRLSEAIRGSNVTTIQATPATWQLLVEARWTGKKDLKLLCGGEALPKLLADQLLERGRVWNGYGPTETTIYSTAAKLTAGDSTVPIGRPLANTRLYVLDGNRQLVPVGVPGELYIGGEGLAQGYWKHPELSAERFIPNPFATDNATKLYRTGDLVRYLPDGRLEFLRRVDTQVKIRGFRVELEEVESVLRQYTDVHAAAAKVVEVGPADKRLIAYLVPNKGSTIRDAELREFLKRKLPSYMVPSDFVLLEDLPLTSNGKVDRDALSRTTPSRLDERQNNEPRAPGDHVEMLLVQIWEEVLHREQIGIDDCFFDLGGHSLLGVRLLSRVWNVFKVQLTLASFFEAPTVAHMASLLRTCKAPSGSQVIRIQRSGWRPPLVVVHPQPSLRPVLQRLGKDQPVIGISLFDPSALPVPCRLEEIAALQIEALRSFRPEGPYLLAGYCAHGVLAYEMARQLTAQGQSVPTVVMFDSINPAIQNEASWSIYKNRLWLHLGKISRLDSARAVEYSIEHLRNLVVQIKANIEIKAWRARYRLHGRDDCRLDQSSNAYNILQLAVREYHPRPYAGCVLLICAEDSRRTRPADATLGWNTVVPELDITEVPGNHTTMFTEPNVQRAATVLNAKLLEISRASLDTFFDDANGSSVVKSPGLPAAVGRPPG